MQAALCFVSDRQTDPALSPACHVLCARYAGVLSAVGIHLADIVQEAQEPAATELAAAELPGLMARLEALADQAAERLRQQGFKDSSITTQKYLNLRCVGVGAMCGCMGKNVWRLGVCVKMNYA